MKAIFTRAPWEDVGEDGWLINGASEAYNPITGFGLCHDFFEHNCKLDTIQDEIMAHGAMYWLRWESGYAHQNRAADPKEIGHEWENLLQGMPDAYLAPCPRTQRLDEDVEETLAAIIAEGLQVTTGDDGYTEWDKDDRQAIAQNYAGWFRKGYRWAANHYKCGRDRAVWDGFKALEKELEELERNELYHGDELHVSFSPTSAKLTVTLKRACGMCSAMIDTTEDYLCSACRDAEEGV